MFKRQVGFGSGHGPFTTSRTRPVPSVGLVRASLFHVSDRVFSGWVGFF
jgi:hypothetical protein